ncbi:MAG: hypothetical protein GF353_16850 [Candidatus Lokiarchaeota archaeon]|nr:hypothetical protein [Candidatus Lokiarchaeota archaeon]
MKIAVDVNGVLIDNMENVIEVVNRKYNSNYKKEDVNNWEFYKEWNFSEREFFDIFYKTYEEMDKVKFIDPEAPNFMKKLTEFHEVNILSALNDQFEALVKNKLERHNIIEGIHYNEMIIVAEKPWDLKVKHRFDLYIDDNPNLVNPIKKMKDRFLFLFDQPWNYNIENHDNIIRVHNWKEIYKNINNLE